MPVTQPIGSPQSKAISPLKESKLVSHVFIPFLVVYDMNTTMGIFVRNQRRSTKSHESCTIGIVVAIVRYDLVDRLTFIPEENLSPLDLPLPAPPELSFRHDINSNSTPG